jgi:hypothetical protein
MISTIEIAKRILFVKDTSPHFFFVMMCLARRVELIIESAPVHFGIISNERNIELVMTIAAVGERHCLRIQ